MSDMLDIRALVRLLILARVELVAQEAALNAMNVFPIPDGDTGTNMRATLDAGLRASSTMKAPDQVAAHHVVRAIARSAQGNSGVILAEYIQGFLSEARPMPDGGFGLNAQGLARALNEAARRTRKAVAEPVEGTVITVADAAAAGAVRASQADRGVLPATSGRSLVRRLVRSPLRDADACQVRADGPGYEVMAVAEGLSREHADDLRDSLGEVGESVVVAGSQGLYRLHVHTSAVVTVLSAMRAYGTVSNVSVVKFTDPVQCDAVITTPDPGLYEYARALGITVAIGESAVFLGEECVARTCVEVLEFLEELEFATDVAGEMPDLLAAESSWLVASYETMASAHETLTSLQDDGMEDRAIMVLISPSLAEADRYALNSWAREHPEISLLNVDSGYPIQIGISHE